ncbi:MAG TPA: SCO family protein [Steroidobacteraceae bacterium]
MKTRSWIYIVALAAAGGIAGLYVGRMLTRPAIPSLEAGTSYPRPKVLAEFDLVDTRGNKTSPATLSGHPSLVFFGFTYCPDVCPTTLAVLSSVQKQVGMPGLKVVLISVDPERDTPEQLGKYISSFGGDLIGLTGPSPEIVKSLKTFGVAASRVDLPGGGYTMDHSATIFALDKAARIVAVFTPPFNAAALTRDVERLEPVLSLGAGS